MSPSEGDFRYIPEGSDLELGVAGYAKVISSAIFGAVASPRPFRRGAAPGAAHA